MLDQTDEMTRRDYEYVRRLVYAQSGINLGEQKMQLVKSRLGKRVRDGGYGSFRAYFKHVEEDSTGEELCILLDSISTNTTHLFRESQHFKLLGELIRAWAKEGRWRASGDALRIWSAGCSSGEEPYSIVMEAHEALQQHSGVELKILATDLSVQMLSKAKLGEFEDHRVGTVPPTYRKQYLKPTSHDRSVLQVVPELRQKIKFARFNLMSSTFPFKQGFDVIFCRNVMIYFDKKTQETLVNKFARHLNPGGYLMIGHSESLSGVEHPLKYVQPTVYRKD
ncbi:protein-glutamate O-methyltransferase CheR [Candidatus Bipolaricaulota bacterium]|nr:protein-glutamate O-methyltransferase CheR [Candidatus Bipolaricaulota bacterium]